MPGRGTAQGAEDSTPSAESSADLNWPVGVSREQLRIDLAWLVFFLIAIGLNLPFYSGRLEAFVWFPADLAALIAIWLRPGPFLAVARRNALILTWPLLAMTSTIWSVSPNSSFYHGAQLLMTVLVGILLSLHAGLFRVLQIYFLALAMAAVLSLFFVFASPGMAVWPSGEWQGVFRHKNMLGHAMGTLIVTGVCLFLQGWRPRFTAAVTAFAAGMLLMSRSGSAIVTVIVALSPLMLIVLYRQGYIVFIFTIGVLLSAAAVGLLYIDSSGIDLKESVLEALGKDSTLTGRTILWEFGLQAFEENPWLGYGYHGWWESGETAVGTLRMVVKQDLALFHNNFLEVAVAFGIWGPLALGSVILFVVITSARAFLADPQYIKAWPLLYMVLILFLCTSENPLFNNHGLHEVLLVAVGTAGMRRSWDTEPAALPAESDSGSGALPAAGGVLSR